MKKLSFILTISILSLLTINCQTWKTLNVYSIDDDKKMGAAVSQEITSKPSEYPLLPEKGNEEVYTFVRDITHSILNSGRVKNKAAFKWEVKIIKNDKTLNAFCTPGGYIYIYTGIIKYLDRTDELAGVIGHEIAHADNRHSTQQLTKAVGASTIAQVLSGNNQTAQTGSQLLVGLLGLQFSRDHEAEADKFSVIYLCNSGYSADGAAGFFKKIGSKGSPPEFLSDHPDPGNRIKDIEALNAKLHCGKSSGTDTKYARIKSLL